MSPIFSIFEVEIMRETNKAFSMFFQGVLDMVRCTLASNPSTPGVHHGKYSSNWTADHRVSSQRVTVTSLRDPATREGCITRRIQVK